MKAPVLEPWRPGRATSLGDLSRFIQSEGEKIYVVGRIALGVAAHALSQ